MPFWRRKQLPTLDEAEAYQRSYGERGDEVRLVKLPPRRPRDVQVLATGELLRRAFLDRLEQRDAEEDETGQDEGEQDEGEQDETEREETGQEEPEHEETEE